MSAVRVTPAAVTPSMKEQEVFATAEQARTATFVGRPVSHF